MTSQDRRVDRVLITFGVVGILFCIGITTFVSVKMNHVKYVIVLKPKNGEDGKQGPVGIGVQGLQGIQGLSIVGQTGKQGIQGVAGAPSSVPGPTGAKGEKGDTGQEGAQGPVGRVIIQRTNPDGTQQCRYAGDMTWQPIEECV